MPPVTDQRQRLARRIKELQPVASQRAIAKVVGVGAATINRDLQPVPSETPVAFEPADTVISTTDSVPTETRPAPVPKSADLGGAAVAKQVQADKVAAVIASIRSATAGVTCQMSS